MDLQSRRALGHYFVSVQDSCRAQKPKLRNSLGKRARDRAPASPDDQVPGGWLDLIGPFEANFRLRGALGQSIAH
jgi:hypothetical protein